MEWGLRNRGVERTGNKQVCAECSFLKLKTMSQKKLAILTINLGVKVKKIVLSKRRILRKNTVFFG